MYLAKSKAQLCARLVQEQNTCGLVCSAWLGPLRVNFLVSLKESTRGPYADELLGREG